MKHKNRHMESSFSQDDQSTPRRFPLLLSSVLLIAMTACSNDGADDSANADGVTKLPPIGAAYSESLGILQGTPPVDTASELTQDTYHAATLTALLDPSQNSATNSGGLQQPVVVSAPVPATPVVNNPSVNTPDPPVAAPQSPAPDPQAPIAQPVTAPQVSTPVELPSVSEPVTPIPVSIPVPPTTVSELVTPTAQGTYESYSTPGFKGSVNTNGTISLEWPATPGAKGYNVFRASEFYKSVATASMTDSSLTGANYYYYEIQAYDYNDQFTPAGEGLTVWVNPSTAQTVPAIPTHVSAGYELVFSDEFQSNTLDASKWTTSHLWGDNIIINSEEQYYVDTINDPGFGFDPFELNGETLNIKSIRTPPELLQKARNQKYLSGVITSYDAFKFTYGYVEARARLPRGRGLWAAFWLLNAYYVDLKPEIDIIEHIGHDVDVVYHTYHYFDENGELRSTEADGSKGTDFTAGFHTYAVEWKPGTAIFYIDGVETHRVTDSKMSSQDMYIIANTALGGWWAGPPDSTTPFPGSYEIDYIRAYQKRGPQDDLPFDDEVDSVPLDVQNTIRTPNHIPSFNQWPAAYPER